MNLKETEAKMIRQFAEAYMNAKQELISEMNPRNIKDSLKNISIFNFIHIEVNQKMYSLICQQYKNQSHKTREQMIQYLFRYRRKFFFPPENEKEFTFSENKNGYYKFLIQGNYQRDLVNYNDMIKALDHKDDYKIFGSIENSNPVSKLQNQIR